MWNGRLERVEKCESSSDLEKNFEFDVRVQMNLVFEMKFKRLKVPQRLREDENVLLVVAAKTNKLGDIRMSELLFGGQHLKKFVKCGSRFDLAVEDRNVDVEVVESCSSFVFFGEDDVFQGNHIVFEFRIDIRHH